jgi:hypothetical protein
VPGTESQFRRARFLPVGNGSDNLALLAKNIPTGRIIANN